MTRRRRVQKSGLQTHEFPASFGARRFPKGNEGKRVSSGYNRRRRLATRSSGKQQAERTAVRTAPIVCPEESSLVRPWAYTSRCWGLTRRLRRGWWGCRPEGGSTFFRSERKYQRKHAARRLRRRPTSLRAVGFGLREPLRGCPRPRLAALTRRKKAFIAHFDGGARNVARNEAGQLTHTGGARSCSPFSADKMGGPFSLRCLSPPCPGAVGGGHTQPLQGGMLWRSLCFFRKAKGQREIKSTLALVTSHEARRRMAVSLRPSCFPPSALRA